MAAFDSLQRASFIGVEFPVREVDCNGGIRYHVHEYPHAPGGKVEKMGRKPYEIRMTVPFHANLFGWKDLWPDSLQKLRASWEAERTGDLVIPTIGTLPCVCVDWPGKMRANVRSGEDFELRFIEDTENAFLFDALVQAAANDVAGAAVALQDAADEAEYKPSFLDSIAALTASIGNIKDQLQDVGGSVTSAISQIKDLVQTADDTASFLKNPSAEVVKILDAMHELWDAVDRLDRDIREERAPLIDFFVPRDMSIGEIAAQLYGDASRGGELLGLNPVPDAFAVRAGTSLRAYAA